ncbi:MAG: hypothetical protein AABX16_04820 [Nanoarchaeota archaeon]
MDQEIRATLLGLVTALIGLIALYYPEQRITIIILYLITFFAYIIYSYLNRIENHATRIEELEKSFKRAEDLITVKADIESLKRGLQ